MSLLKNPIVFVAILAVILIAIASLPQADTISIPLTQTGSILADFIAVIAASVAMYVGKTGKYPGE